MLLGAKVSASLAASVVPERTTLPEFKFAALAMAAVVELRVML